MLPSPCRGELPTPSLRIMVYSASLAHSVPHGIRARVEPPVARPTVSAPAFIAPMSMRPARWRSFPPACGPAHLQRSMALPHKDGGIQRP